MNRAETRVAIILGLGLLIVFFFVVAWVGAHMFFTPNEPARAQSNIATPTPAPVSASPSAPVPAATHPSVPRDTTPRRATVSATSARNAIQLPAGHPGVDGSQPCESCHTNLRGKGK
ncbi:MAG: hypothetical protein HY868_06500 [Chloroflexi bacterium]|nr:hypothetical protein [Chloroflexota bacterium]